MSYALTGLPLFSLAISVMLSAIIRLLVTLQLKQRVSFKQTGLRELAELSGISDVRELQQTFGPPGMNRIWSSLGLADIERRKRLGGYLMTDARLHWASIGSAIVALTVPISVLQIFLVFAGLAQFGAWAAVLRLPK